VNKKTLTSLFLRGLIDTLPLIVACIPFAIVYGALAVDAGLSFSAAMGISIFVFAGASQFVAVTLIAASTPFLVIVVTVFIVNLRHLLYSLNLMRFAKPLTPWQRIPMAFWMTDESFAAVTRYLQQKPTDQQLHQYYWGSAVGMYSNWIFFSGVGIYLGKAIPDMTSWGLDMAMVLAFTAIVVTSLKHRAHILCMIVAIVAAIITYDWPYKSGLLFSSLLAIAVGVWVELNTNKNKRENQA